jgi:hypothetical protein
MHCVHMKTMSQSLCTVSLQLFAITLRRIFHFLPIFSSCLRTIEIKNVIRQHRMYSSIVHFYTVYSIIDKDRPIARRRCFNLIPIEINSDTCTNENT